MSGLEIGILCLALNIWFEARSEPEQAQMAVALVTINRSRKKGEALCETVYAPHQFSWTIGIRKPPQPAHPAWIQAQRIAIKSLNTKDFTGGALWYHHYGITPWWVWNKQKTGKWGAHVFYKCKPKHQCNWR